ncbi:hypothetical protein ABGB18_15410 [Nonomuraea sp. B12E4]|uniref:carbohydrate ABC transporter permease n=1 Tax=Nonomuraea sp. B12E4 TaxID=3153564 RepID=UPI00325CE2BC
MTSPTRTPQAPSPALGWLLAAPALLGTLISLVLPTGQSIWLSFQSGGVLKEATFAGPSNYTELLGGGDWWRALGFTVSLSLMPLLVALVVGPLLAVALDRGGIWVRRAGRIVLSLAVVTFSPVAVALGWIQGTMQDSTGITTLVRGLREQATAPGTMRLLIAAGTFGVVCALATMAFLPALRGGRVVPAMLVVAALVALAMIATGLQTFSIAFVLSRGGPQGSTRTLAQLQYDNAFTRADFGAGAAVAVLAGVILGVLGIVATVIAVVSRLSITVTGRARTGQEAPQGAFEAFPQGAPGSPALPQGAPGASGFPRGTRGAPGFPQGPAGSPGFREGAPAASDLRQGSPERRAGAAGMAVGVVALVVVVAVALVLAWPWIDGVLGRPGGGRGAGPQIGLRTQVNTWVPAVAGAIISVGVAYLGALGIGGLRPLGRRSEWLLLAFAPWLFVGPGPFAVANWQNMRNLGVLDSFLSLFPPLLVSVPALLVLTLLCKGLAERTDRDFFSGVFVPSLPMAGILAGAVTLLNAHDLLWPLLVAQDTALFPTPVAQLAGVSAYGTAPVDVGAATPLVIVAVAVIAVVAAQVLYLDRLAVTLSGSRPRTPTA